MNNFVFTINPQIIFKIYKLNNEEKFTNETSPILFSLSPRRVRIPTRQLFAVKVKVRELLKL